MLAALCASAFAISGTASACSFDAWGGGTNPTPPNNGITTTGAGKLVAGNPTPADADGVVPRYSGKCGALSKEAGNFVTDGSPGIEKKYFALFYVFTSLATGSATVFKAVDTGSAEKIRVDYNADAGNFGFSINGAAPVTLGTPAIVRNRWYAIGLDWQAGSSMAVRVKGTAQAQQATTVPGSLAGDQIDTASLGWISGVGTTDGTRIGIATDAFVSQRATAPPRLCRGDSNGDGNRNAGDATQARLEFLSGGATLQNFQPDCNEDGAVNAGDATCARILFLAGLGSCATGN
jgi:hypothetical protein